MIESIKRTIDTLCGNGARRPGSAANLQAEAFLADELRSLGFEVTMQPITIPTWEADRAEFTISADGENFSPAVGPIPHAKFTPEGGVTAKLVWINSVSDLKKAARSGQPFIAVCDFPFAPINPSLLLALSMAANDPYDSLKKVSHKATWIRKNWYLYREAHKYGASGFVGILSDQPGGSAQMYAPYGFREQDITDKPLPGLYVGKHDGDRLKKLAQAGATATLTLTGKTGAQVTHNVIGRLNSTNPNADNIVLGSHHDSPHGGWVEDATGCSVVMELARDAAQNKNLRSNLVVVFTTGHFHGSIGTRLFIEAHLPELVEKTKVAIWVEHCGALEADEDLEGRLVGTGESEPTAFFVSWSHKLRQAVIQGMKYIDRSVALPAESPLGNYPPTDGGDFYAAGIPVINGIANPVYLLTDEDSPKWIDWNKIELHFRAYRAMLCEVDSCSKRDLRSTGNWLYALTMMTLCVLTRAVATRFGTRPLY